MKRVNFPEDRRMTAKERLMAIKQVDLYDCFDPSAAIEELATRYQHANSDEERAALQSFANWLVQDEPDDWDARLDWSSNEETVQ